VGRVRVKVRGYLESDGCRLISGVKRETRKGTVLAMKTIRQHHLPTRHKQRILQTRLARLHQHNQINISLRLGVGG
jgi:hypothetical protein